MQRLLRGVHPLWFCLGVCLLATTASADFGGWINGLNGQEVPVAEALLIAGVVLCALSALLLTVALLHLTGRCLVQPGCSEFCLPISHGVLVALWLPVVGMAAFLLSRHHYPSIAFLVAGVLFAAAHIAVISSQLCWCCCGGAFVGGWGAGASDHPKSALLTAQNGGGGARGGGSADNGAAGGGATSSTVTDAEAAAGAASRNPFRATYGLLPGSSSVFAYQIFLPGGDEEQANATSYTGLQSGPGPAGKGRRDGKGRRGGRAAQQQQQQQVVHQPLQALQTSLQSTSLQQQQQQQQQGGPGICDTRS
ncbi:hypothetical protein Agub_g4921 [Astrephomene gubernaculifera]|uniref:Uncharacterized protein n=1 Tax=Astrephomene gubernaculifera TaxID=47775 RepID=A0AAD3HK64_9CHLO|nr:hypothetical protein Agub_g4921 [Astrephomene gubernaculifera]